MELLVKRGDSLKGSTIGELYVDGVRECFTLEDQVREVPGPVAAWKIPGETAIPRGRYQVIVDMSAHFGRLLPHVLNVPGYEGVRIHPGNSAKDTEGCILLGLTREANLIYQSRAAFDAFFLKLQAALKTGQTAHITVS